MDSRNDRLPVVKAMRPDGHPPVRTTPWPPERDGERGLSWSEAIEAIEEQTRPVGGPWWRAWTRRGR